MGSRKRLETKPSAFAWKYLIIDSVSRSVCLQNIFSQKELLELAPRISVSGVDIEDYERE